ncbi:MAG: M28 family peptidase [Betaproteobacteria bacterium]|nr:M28 family peptidase [Betaproteobacteria bacterium]
MPGVSHRDPLAPLPPDEILVRDNLRRHVAKLAGEIGERSMKRYDGLTAAADYIRDVLAAQGWRVAEQTFESEGRPVRNIEAELLGTTRPNEILVIGAHYDSLTGTTGANDNATGTAAVLELARLLNDARLDRTVRLVAFVNEEPPYYYTEAMGSRVYARRARERSENIAGMLSLETIGYYSDQPRSQHYPAGLGLFYPDAGNFIAFVGNLASRDLVRRSVRAFRQSVAFPSEGGAFPGWIVGVEWSDHWSFGREGYPAIMVTDTALFRYPHYHSREDTPDKVDYDRMARVVRGLAGVVTTLANADENS